MSQAPQTSSQEESVPYVSARQKRREGPQTMQPPLTPMIDVTFQLLIFFIIGFQLRPNEGLIPSSLPAKGVGAATEDISRPVTISVRPGEGGGVIYECGNVRTSDVKQLYAALEAQAPPQGGKGQKKYVQIRVAGDVEWQYVVEAFNASVRAKLERVAFATN